MGYGELHIVLDEVERLLEQQGGNIVFGIHNDASLGISSNWEDQKYNHGPRAAMVYNLEQGLYFWAQGARLTPGKRPYPTRYFNGELDGSQPEFYYTTVQQVAYSPIVEQIDDTHYRVWPNAVSDWPSVAPFYLYLAQKDQGSGDNTEQSWGPTYRYVKVDGDEAKILVSEFDGEIVTLAKPLILNIPEPDTEDWETYSEEPLFFVFFDRRIDELLSARVTQLVGDEENPNISLTDSTKIIETFSLSSIQIRVADIYIANEDGEFDFVESDMPTPEDQEAYVLLRADGGTIIRSDRVQITNAVFTHDEVQNLYEEIDPSDPFTNIDVSVDVEDPFEDIPPPDDLGEGGDIDPIIEQAITGKIVYRYYTVYFEPYVATLEAGQDFSYFEEVVEKVSDISDDELSVELFATSQSIRPHTFHLLSPLKAPSYASVYNFNWAAPMPYPMKTVVEDCDEPTINGYLADDLTRHRMVYSRARNSWRIGGNVMCICRNFRDAGVVEDCILRHRFDWYFKMRALNNDLTLYHMAFTTWQ